MERLAVYTWMARPLRTDAEPAPATDFRPEMKSVASESAGMRKGDQRSWSGTGRATVEQEKSPTISVGALMAE